MVHAYMNWCHMENVRTKDIFSVALYTRLSREDGDKGESDSIANQRKMLKRYISKEKKFIIYSEYSDDGYSGTNYNRPDFKRMIADIEGGFVNCVIVKDLSRFGRDYIDTGYYLERYFAERNVRFIAINDNIDSFIKEYDMLMPVKNIFNAQYAKDISCKVQSSFKVKQKSGEFIGAFASYGYRKSERDGHKLMIDEYAAAVVREVFQQYIEGNGKLKIAQNLNERGILCPSEYKKMCGDKYSNGNRLDKTTYWTYSTIHKMLSNEMYIGNMVQGKTRRRMKGKPKRVEKDEWIIVKNTHEHIIDIETWDKVQSLLSRDTKQLDFNQNISLFSGFLRCGDCSRAMCKKIGYQRKGEKNKPIYYSCGSYTRYGKRYCSSHKISHEALEAIILGDLKTIIQSVDNIKAIVASQKKNVLCDSKSPKHEEDKLKIELARVEKLKRETYDDYKDKLLSKEEYLSYRKFYEEKKELLEKRIDSLENKYRKSDEIDIFDMPWIRRLLLTKEIVQLDRDIITAMIDHIYIYENGRIKIVYNFSDEHQLFPQPTIPMG